VTDGRQDAEQGIAMQIDLSTWEIMENAMVKWTQTSSILPAAHEYGLFAWNLLKTAQSLYHSF